MALVTMQFAPKELEALIQRHQAAWTNFNQVNSEDAAGAILEIKAAEEMLASELRYQKSIKKETA